MYQVKLEIFEGPFDLLLSLISQHKLDVYKISIAQITDEYLGYLQKMQELDLEVASEFLLVAATLLEMKSAGLLPQPDKIVSKEEFSVEEERELLINRLLEYKKFKNASRVLCGRMEAQAKFFPRVASLEEPFQNLLPDFLEGITLQDLSRLFENLRNRERICLIDSSHIATIKFSVEEKMAELLEQLKALRRQSFRALTAKAVTREEIIASFLALLELYKRGQVAIFQAVTFGEIEVVYQPQ